MKILPRQCDSCQLCPAGSAAGAAILQVERGQADFVVALAGNPNTGKSTVFNALTGLHQHTGNWPGKTVTRAEGFFTFQGKRFKLVDLPGTYSLMATSYDEEVARDFLLFGRPDVTIIVVDATRLERNLNLALQVLEITDRAVICLNLMDEARRHGITIDVPALERELGVPVVPAAARFGQGIDELVQVVAQVAQGERTCHPRRVGGEAPSLKAAVDQLSQLLLEAFPGLTNANWVALRLLDGDPNVTEAVRSGMLGELGERETLLDGSSSLSRTGTEQPAGDSTRALRETIIETASSLRWQIGMDFHQTLVETIYAAAAEIADRVVRYDEAQKARWEEKLDRILTSPLFGYPIMVALFLVVIWITVQGANYPSALLNWLLVETLYPAVRGLFVAAGAPSWITGLLVDGGLLATAWVVSVMLPPMAIFFPLFTLLEDLGYLPRVAFNLDRFFRWAGAHGKQALTMTMGFGCNAAGVVACRIIDSPRERLVAILTNNFSLCNGRWPTQILLATIFLGSLVPPYLSGAVAAAGVVGVALLGIIMTFVVSWLLTRTVLRGEVSTFHLELPPYRPPQILQTLYTSLIDRTLIVLWRAVVFAFPAGMATWAVANIWIGGDTLAAHIVRWLDPFGRFVGLNGVILLAYVVAIPANEIVIPTILMLTVLLTGAGGIHAQAGVLFEPEDLTLTARIFQEAGWTPVTALCLMLFSLMHNPCSTTIYTIYKETGSTKWTIVAVVLPILMGLTACFLVNATLGRFF
ncbi:MAG: ferrous iron transport protein B [Thermogutta sp.]|nr:MAG: ferrous iron transport protein B [Thermogutta sp.]